jgi:hypothetical protein
MRACVVWTISWTFAASSGLAEVPLATVIESEVVAMRLSLPSLKRVEFDFPGGAEGGFGNAHLDRNDAVVWLDLWDFGHMGKGHTECAVQEGSTVAIRHEEYVYNAPNWADEALIEELRADGATNVEVFDSAKTQVSIERYYFADGALLARFEDAAPEKEVGSDLWNDAAEILTFCRDALALAAAPTPPAPSESPSLRADPPLLR